MRRIDINGIEGRQISQEVGPTTEAPEGLNSEGQW